MDGFTAGARSGTVERKPKGHQQSSSSRQASSGGAGQQLDVEVVVQRTPTGTIFDGTAGKGRRPDRHATRGQEPRGGERVPSRGPPASQHRPGESGDGRSQRGTRIQREPNREGGRSDKQSSRGVSTSGDARNLSSASARDDKAQDAPPASPLQLKGPPPGLESASLNPTARIFQPDLSPVPATQSPALTGYESQQYVSAYSGQVQNAQESRGSVQYNLHPDYSGLPVAGGNYTQQDLQVIAVAAAAQQQMSDGSGSGPIIAADGSVWYSSPDLQQQQGAVYYQLPQQQQQQSGGPVGYVTYSSMPSGAQQQQMGEGKSADASSSGGFA